MKMSILARIAYCNYLRPGLMKASATTGAGSFCTPAFDCLPPDGLRAAHNVRKEGGEADRETREEGEERTREEGTERAQRAQEGGGRRRSDFKLISLFNIGFACSSHTRETPKRCHLLAPPSPCLYFPVQL